MANINQYGYEKIRSFILGSWKYLELRQPDGTALKRFGTADGLTMNVVGDVVEYKVVVTGSDPTFSNQTVARSVVFDVASGGSAIVTENFTSFTFEQAEDSLTVIHRLQVPKVI